jgi:hypothetical protein
MLQLNGIKISCRHRRHFYNKSYFLMWAHTVLLVWLFYLQYLCSLYEDLVWWWPQVFQPKHFSSSTTAAGMCNVQVQTLIICCTLDCDNVSRWTIYVLGFGLVVRGELCSAQCPCLLRGSPITLEICLFCTVSMPTERLTSHLRDPFVLHSVHAYCGTRHNPWRSVCSAQCPCLLWDSPNLLEIFFTQCPCLLCDSPNLLEICLFCTVSIPTVRLTKYFWVLSVLHSVHAYCQAQQTSSLNSKTGTHFSFFPSHRGRKRDYVKMLHNLIGYSKSYKHRFSFFAVNGIKF